MTLESHDRAAVLITVKDTDLSPEEILESMWQDVPDRVAEAVTASAGFDTLGRYHGAGQCGWRERRCSAGIFRWFAAR